ncbi:MAG: HPr(Ser) kinase/phosphatase [Dorea sp.]|nr:HPr(Ser) kinase/phosphatase [Dorea sp.]
MYKGVKLKKLVEKMQLTNLTPNVSIDDKYLEVPDINRPALQLAGFFEHYDTERLQLVGFVEYTYLEEMDRPRKNEIYKKFLEYKVPGIIFCRNLQPEDFFLNLAEEAGIPIFMTDKKTSQFEADIIRWLKTELAPCISIHGVLVEVYGIGVLIMGESGIGKSECALELVRRGHRLVSDDVVEVRKISEDTLIGSAPEITRHFIELRGIGIVDVKMLFGAMSVRDNQSIDLVITVEEWEKDKEYDRIGMTDQYTEFLGNKVVCHKLPVRPGRNLAIIVETAAINHRQKQMGYNAAEELYRRIQINMTGEF